MSIELLSMLGGGVTGFIMRYLSAQSEAQQATLKMLLAKQKASDASADAAANRTGGIWVRRLITVVILFAVVIAPFILALTSVPVAIEVESKGLLGLFNSTTIYEQVQGFIILPEVRQGMLALLSFYFGSSMVRS